MATPYRPLFPEAVRNEDKLTLLSGLMRYLRRYGYWPKRSELRDTLRSERAATTYLLQELTDAKLVELLPWRSGHARYQLTSRGWQLIGVAPIEPWRRPPSKMLVRRIAIAAAERLRRSELRAEETGT